jgi:phage terminase small subunit
MAGVKGRSGGPRLGSGRKRKPPSIIEGAPTESPLAFLTAVMNDEKQDARLRVRAAVAAAQYVHHKIGDGGKKADQRNAAKKAGIGKFAPAPAPLKLVKNA